jgi:hypothetical protein
MNNRTRNREQERMTMSVRPKTDRAREKAGSPTSDWWEYLQRARAELEAAGATFTTGEAIQSYVAQLRGESDRVEAIYWEASWQKYHGDSA